MYKSHYTVYKWNWKRKLRYKLGQMTLKLYYFVSGETQDDLMESMVAYWWEKRAKEMNGLWAVDWAKKHD